MYNLLIRWEYTNSFIVRRILLPKLAALFICFPMILFTSCTKGYEVKDIVRHSSLANCERPLDQDIETSKLFSERFISAYLIALRKEVKPSFYRSFYLGQLPFRIKAIFSSNSESFIHISPGGKNEMEVECVQYPIQMSLLSGLETEGQNVQLKTPAEEALRMYQRAPGIIGAAEEDSIFYVQGLSLDLVNPKAINVSKRSIAVLLDVRVLNKRINPNLRPVVFDHINFLNSATDFSWALERADEVARDIVTSEIQELFTQSEFFRQALVHEELKSKAGEIQQKLSRAKSDHSFDYPLWEFKKDIAELKQQAQGAGIEDSYVDELVMDLSSKQHSGFLLWYYSDYWGFTKQWVIVEVCLLILLVGLIMVSSRFRKKKIAGSLIGRLALVAVVLVINGWIFSQRPAYLELRYSLLPGSLLLICIALAVRAEEKLLLGRKKDSS